MQGSHIEDTERFRKPEYQEFTSVDFTGPVKTRRCTDLCCLLIILLAWGAMTLLGVTSLGWYTGVEQLNEGHPPQLIHGMDYEGHLCGYDGPVKNLPYYWEPNYNGITPSSTGVFVPTEFGICVDTCPDSSEPRDDPYGNYGYWAPLLSTSMMAGRCVPIDMDPAINFLQDTFYDFYQTAAVIALLGFGLATVISFLFLVCIRTPCMLRILVWLCAVVVVVVSAGGAFFSYEKANAETQASGANSLSIMQINLLRGLCAVLAAFAVLWTCLLVFLRSRINLAVGLIKESSHAIISMPLLYFSPIFNVLLMAGFTAVWLVYCIYLVTSGEITTLTEDGIDYKKPVLNDYSRYSLIFMAFIWLWTMIFIHAASQWICAHSVVTWYFSLESAKVGSMQVIRSTFVFLRYHVGTVAFGSLVLAIVQTLRTVLMYIKSKLKNKTNVIVKMVMCCCSCCLYMLAKFIQFMDKQAYIQSALNGTGFCTSARRAFGLLFRNFARVATISVISTFVMFVGKVGVSIVSAGIGYYYMITYMDKELNGYTVPTIAVFVIAYMCSAVFLDIVSMASDASLQAFLVDEEVHFNANGQLGDASAAHGNAMLNAYMRKNVKTRDRTEERVDAVAADGFEEFEPSAPQELDLYRGEHPSSV